MSRARLITFKIDSELYPFHVVFHIGPHPEPTVVGRLTKRYGLWNGEGELPHCGTADSTRAATVHFGNGSFVWLKDTDPTPEFFRSFNHEIVHVLMNLGAKVGEYPDFKHDEPFAYFSGWLAGEFVRQIIRRRGRLDSRK